MGLTSGTLIGLLIVLAVLCSAATVWQWPKVAGAGVQSVIARTAMLLGCQFVVLLALLVAMNSYFSFFATWGDLLGTSNNRVGVVTRHSGHFSLESSLSVGPAPSDLSVHGPPDKVGQTDQVMITGLDTGIRSPAYVYQPPQYFQPAYAHTRFPVIVALTGYPGDARNLITRMDLPSLEQQELSAGRMRPALMVMLRPTVVPPRDTECTNIPGGPQTADFFGQDVPTSIASRYRVSTQRTGWSMLGDSTGGYCAAKVVMMNSDRYIAGVALSAYFNSLQDSTTGDLYGGSKLFRSENDLFWRLQHLPSPPVSLMLTTSKSGETDYGAVQRMVAMAQWPMHVTELVLPTGGHNFRTWTREVPPALDWLSKSLVAQGAPAT